MSLFPSPSGNYYEFYNPVLWVGFRLDIRYSVVSRILTKGTGPPEPMVPGLFIVGGRTRRAGAGLFFPRSNSALPLSSSLGGASLISRSSTFRYSQSASRTHAHHPLRWVRGISGSVHPQGDGSRRQTNVTFGAWQ